MASIEETYFTVSHFCKYKKYPLAKNLIPLVEKDLTHLCLIEEISTIKKTNRTTRHVEIAFPQSRLEEYLKLWI